MRERNSDLHKGHRKRMRKRFADHGIGVFSRHELIEFMLFFAMPRGDTNELAHLLENEIGSPGDIVNAPRERLLSIKGVGASTALYLNFLAQFSAYLRAESYGNEMKKGAAPADIKEYFMSLFICERDECVYAAAFDSAMRFVCSKKIASGNICSVASPVRLLYDFAVASGCSRMIIAHNHPGASCIPSPTDIYNTKDLVSRLGWLDIAVEDHIIVGTDGALSLRGSMHAKDIWEDRQ